MSLVGHNGRVALFRGKQCIGAVQGAYLARPRAEFVPMRFIVDFGAKCAWMLSIVLFGEVDWKSDYI